MHYFPPRSCLEQTWVHREPRGHGGGDTAALHQRAGDRCVRESVARAFVWAGGGLYARVLGNCTPGCSSRKALGHFAWHHTAGREGDSAGPCNRDGAARLCSWPQFRELKPTLLSSCRRRDQLRAPCTSC